MRTQCHGVTSLGLVLVATVVAAVVMFRTSWVLGVVYLAVCAAAPGAILYAYCAKCPCQTHCGHVFLGRVAMAFSRQPGPYTIAELAALALALLSLIGLPQLWLWRYTGLFIAYWLLTAVALVQIKTFVCRACENVFCPLKGESLTAGG
jgi:hypothetical protein